MSKLLVVEDEPDLVAGLSKVLRGKGYEVDTCMRGDEGLKMALGHAYALILLDVGLPGLDGFEVLRRLREAERATPVVMLTARGQEVDRVFGFQLGVDDYVTKPYSILELLGRIAAILRRAGPAEPQSETLRFGGVTVDLTRYAIDGSAADALPTKAYDVLKVLAAMQGKVVSRDTLLDRVWGAHESTSQRTLNNLIVKIRHAIEPNPDEPQYLKTVHGLGYRLDLA